MNETFGILPKGRRNLITDVAGVTVGHCTLAHGEVQTGVTALLPHQGDLFHDRCPAAVHVINGFGKSMGLVQVQELGCIETPLLLTNMLSAGTAYTACVRYMLARNVQIGREESTVNPAILECNDGYLNDIRGLHVTEDDVRAALAAAGESFALGAVGAGRGMSCYQLKGGIGSASRLFRDRREVLYARRAGDDELRHPCRPDDRGQAARPLACQNAGERQGLVHHDPRHGRAALLASARAARAPRPERSCAHWRGHGARQRRDRARVLHGEPHPHSGDAAKCRVPQ